MHIHTSIILIGVLVTCTMSFAITIQLNTIADAYKMDFGGSPMKVQPANLYQIRQKGLEVLNRELGPIAMIRFLQQYQVGEG